MDEPDVRVKVGEDKFWEIVSIDRCRSEEGRRRP